MFRNDARTLPFPSRMQHEQRQSGCSSWSIGNVYSQFYGSHRIHIEVEHAVPICRVVQHIKFQTVAHHPNTSAIHTAKKSVNISARQRDLAFRTNPPCVPTCWQAHELWARTCAAMHRNCRAGTGDRSVLRAHTHQLTPHTHTPASLWWCTTQFKIM